MYKLEIDLPRIFCLIQLIVIGYSGHENKLQADLRVFAEFSRLTAGGDRDDWEGSVK